MFHMASTDDQFRYQRFLVMSINAERAARGLSINQLADRAGIDYQTMLRKLNLKRHITTAELSQIADALGVRPSELSADAERRMSTNSGANEGPRRTPRGGGQTGGDLRAIITQYLDNPDNDPTLMVRLGDVSNLPGVTVDELKRLDAMIRSTRREELEQALTALPADEDSGRRTS